MQGCYIIAQGGGSSGWEEHTGWNARGGILGVEYSGWNTRGGRQRESKAKGSVDPKGLIANQIAD